MNAFPDDYVGHNLPLIVLSGLGEEQDDKSPGEKARTLLSEGGFRLKTDIPEVSGSLAQSLRQAFLASDATNSPWHNRGHGQTEQGAGTGAVFRIHCAGRTYTLPPRKAPPPPHSPRLRPATDASSPPPQLTLHSPISPLTPSSPLYPDGIMTPLWITKHQSRLPSIFITFFTLVADPNASTLQDNKLKSEINNIRSVLSTTNYKTKLVVILLGDGDIDSSVADDRVSNVRRSTNLDTKSLYYLSQATSSSELSVFSKNVLSSLYSGSIEYYRDLSKHARRKRNRNVLPQPTIQPSSGTSQILSLAGWNVRYEFKLGVFAEFRQEMEAALRNYEAAYESLFGAEVIETIPSWSPKFNEARLVSDIITIRIIRCLLWVGQTTNAVKSWLNHRERVQSLIDRRGAGSETYGWEAWQSTWSRTMAELIQRAQVLPIPEVDAPDSSLLPLFVSTEKTSPAGQRYTPWESLHHEGYWLNLAQKYTHHRRDRAMQMPDEDRSSPGQSPASVIASKAHLYDKYLTLEPYREYPLGDKQGFDYSQNIIETLDAALQHFSAHDQVRMVQILQLKRASEFMKKQLWQEAVSILRPAWTDQLWRQAGWWTLLEQAGRALFICALETEDLELAAQLKWQLEHPIFGSQNFKEQISNESQKQTNEKSKSQSALDTEHSLTGFIPTFAFASAEGHVGEKMDAQLSLQYIAPSEATNIKPSLIKIVFEGGLKPVYLMDDGEDSDSDNTGDFSILEIDLEDVQSRATAVRRSSLGAAAAVSADVHLALKPGQIKIFQMSLLPREAGDVSVASISMTFEVRGCEMTITTSGASDAKGQWWEVRRGKPTSRSCGRHRDVASAKILPKPPKINIQISEMQKVFYTNESIDLAIETVNQEDQTVSGSIEARLISPGKNTASLVWRDGENSVTISPSDAVTFVQSLGSRELGELGVGSQASHAITIGNTEEAIDHELEVTIKYTLTSSPETLLVKTLTVDIPVVRPFEANFSFHSRFHEETWPDFFSAQTISQDAEKAVGIKQQYLITAVICSFAIEDVVIESTRLLTQKIVGGASCTITPGALKQVGDEQQKESQSSCLIHPEETKRFGFDMTLQKFVLAHRQPVAIDVQLEIRWKRNASEKYITSILQVPRFLAPSAEPRVLLRSLRETSVRGLYCLNYTLENPSLHFLTFNLTMESSDDFAFSGAKSKSVSLVPISRHEVVYRILANKNKSWIRVHLEVVDAYFGQTLRVQPASDGVRVDKQGNVLMWIE